MEALPERLTTSEAAVAAGVSISQIHRIIDEKILPEGLYSTDQMRTFRTDARVLIAFYFETADWLTAQARLRTIRKRNGPLLELGRVAQLHYRRPVGHDSLLGRMEGREQSPSPVEEGPGNGCRRSRDFERNSGHSRYQGSCL